MTCGFDRIYKFCCYCQVEIKRTIPKGSSESRDFKTKKIFVGGIPTSVNEGMLDSEYHNA